MTATLTLADPQTERVARLPLSALYSQGADPSLYIVDAKGEVALKPVLVKSYGSNDVVITGGVDDGRRSGRWRNWLVFFDKCDFSGDDDDGHVRRQVTVMCVDDGYVFKN